VEFEEEDLPPAYPERIINAFCEIPLSQVYPSETLANITAIQDAFADSMGYSYV